MMRASLLIAAVAVVACTSNPLNVATGEFTAPTGLAATAAGDRDLLFIANTGGDSLRALQLCSAPLLLDGGVDPADSCPQSAHGQFVPAPIRLFPASIETGDRPLRVAGVRLTQSDGGAAGVALVAGAGSSLAVVDGRSLVDTQTTGTAPRAVLQLDLGQAADGGTTADGGIPVATADETVDVVAANPLDTRFDLETGAATVTAFAATRSELVVLDVILGSDGFAQFPTVRRCTLDPVVPTRLAVVPGSAAQVFVADGAGDGVVSIQTSSVPAGGGPCVMDRISAGGRSVRSIALSPPWYDQDDQGQPRTRAAGELLLMVLEPATVQPGQTADPGGVLFAGTGLGLVPKGIVPIPPFDPAKEVAEPMRPLSLPNPGGLFNEGAFLRAVKPKAAPEQPDLTACPTAPCTPLSIGQPANAAPVLFPLLAAVSCSDGVTYFIDVANRRLVNQNKYAQANDVGILPLVNGTGLPQFGPAIPAPPTLTLDATKFEPGVTRASSWRVVWHAAIPGLERRGGTIKPVDSDTLRFTVALPNLGLFRDDPAIALAAGDVVSLAGYSIGTDNSAACQGVVSSESTPYRFELTIKDVQPDHLDLQVLPDNATTRGFHPEGCSAFGAVAQVRTARTQPWLVFEGNTIKGRVRDDGTFDAHQPRFDYPRSAYGRTDTDVPPAPIASRDVAFSFTISGPLPDTPQEAGSQFTWSFSSGVFPVAYGDQLHTTAGFATAVYGYSSRRTQSLAFTSVTGMNEVLQADPFLLNSTTTLGLVAYR